MTGEELNRKYWELRGRFSVYMSDQEREAHDLIMEVASALKESR